MKTVSPRARNGLVLGLAAGAVCLGLWFLGVFDNWENVTWDWRVRLLARPSPATENISLVVLDQSSLDWAKEELSLSWPWPRQVYGPLVEQARLSRARVLALDVIFTEPSSIQGDDDLLGQAFKGELPVVAALILGTGAGGVAQWPGPVTARLTGIEGAESWVATAVQGVRADNVVLPIDQVALNARTLGNVGELPDEDQVVRKVGLVRFFDGRAVPSLALAAYAAATGDPLRLEPGRLWLGDRAVPIDSAGRAIVNYRGRPGVHAKFSAAGVIQSYLKHQEGQKPDLDSEAFKDKYLFFGFTAPGLHDLRASPLSPLHPGVEIQATVLDNLLENDFIRPAPVGAVAASILLLALLAGLGVVQADQFRQTFLAFALFVPLPVVIGLIAYRLGLWWPVVGPEAAALSGLVGGVYFNYLTEGRQRRFIKTAFRHYLSPEVIERILKDPSSLQLGGERRELTILFSDLEGFTGISEGLDPAELTHLLNDYLSDMTDIILDEGGTLDKYEGDAIIAFWNAPLDQPDHALRAVRAALKCQAKLAARRAEFQERTGAVLKARLGLHSGMVVVGNMGSRRRFDYTVLGDAANLASRLEGANKVFGTYLMVSEETWNQLNGKVAGRELGRIRVVGRRTPVRVFEPLAMAGETETDLPRKMARALELCRAGSWEEALRQFQSLDDDPAALRYAVRCREELDKDGEAWDAIWRLDKK